MASETAYELDSEAAGYTGTDAVHFADFPGVWYPGQPIAAQELGLGDDDQVQARIDELALPLRKISVDRGAAPMPARPNHLLNTEQESALEAELAEQPKRPTHKDLDAAAASAGLAFPADVKTVDEKVAFLEAAQQGAVTSAGSPAGPTAATTPGGEA